jgi:radical SAM superfamily enzyme YgiQ (UPF0313 family)
MTNKRTGVSSDPTTSEVLLYKPKPAQEGSVRLALAYPAPYSIAMSSLGYMTLFAQLDQNPQIQATRVFSDTLSQYSPKAFDLVGYSFSFELDILQILQDFKTWGLPLYAAERDRHAPLIFAGGPTVMTNPEPFAPFFDFFLIGEGEELLNDLALAYERHREAPTREALLHRLAVEVPGLYAPSLYHVSYHPEEGYITAIEPRFEDVPFPVQKQFVGNLDNFVAASPILTPDTVFSNTFLVEVMRGCSHRCRFCLASYSMLPTRGASLEAIIERIETGLPYTHKIGLLGALIADHPQFPELCDYLDAQMDRYSDMKLSSASLRADTLTSQIARTFKKGKQNQLTIAVESGSESLRRRINKNLKHEAILQAAANVAEAGLRGLKVYGMVGLPDETEDDVWALVELMKSLKRENPKLELHLGCSSFVPKAWTPFQWMPKLDTKTIQHRHEVLRKNLLKVADVRPTSAKWDFFQALLSRGDRRLAPFVVRFLELGGSLGSMQRAFKELQANGSVDFPPLEWYAQRQRTVEEILPWDLLHLGVPKDILYKESLAPPPRSSQATSVA